MCLYTIPPRHDARHGVCAMALGVLRSTVGVLLRTAFLSRGEQIRTGWGVGKAGQVPEGGRLFSVLEKGFVKESV